MHILADVLAQRSCPARQRQSLDDLVFVRIQAEKLAGDGLATHYFVILSEAKNLSVA
jgi:hypothetical protein